MFCFREKRSLYSLVRLPLANGQEEERVNPFQEIAFSNGIRCFSLLAQDEPAHKLGGASRILEGMDYMVGGD